MRKGNFIHLRGGVLVVKEFFMMKNGNIRTNRNGK